MTKFRQQIPTFYNSFDSYTILKFELPTAQRGPDTWLPLYREYFQMHFCLFEWKRLNFDSIVIDINKQPALVLIMAWRPTGTSTWTEPIIIYLLMHICVNLTERVNCRIIELKKKKHQLKTNVLAIVFMILILSLFIRPFEKRDVLCRGNVRLSIRPSAFSAFFFNMLWDINLKLGIYIQ